MTGFKTPEDVRAFHIKVESLRNRLTAATDALNQTLVKLQVAIRELGLNARAQVEVKRQHEYDPSAKTFLIWNRDGNEWVMGVVRQTKKDSKFTRIINASREERLLACDYSPALVDALLLASEQQSFRVESAVYETNELILDVKDMKEE